MVQGCWGCWGAVGSAAPLHLFQITFTFTLPSLPFPDFLKDFGSLDRVQLIPPMEGAWIESKFGPAMKQPDPTCRRSRSYWKQFWLPTMMLFMGDDAACWAAGASLDYDVSNHGYAYLPLLRQTILCCLGCMYRAYIHVRRWC